MNDYINITKQDSFKDDLKDRLNMFRKYIEEMFKLYKDKNEKYGNSFEKTLDKRGLEIAGARMEDKLNRFDSLKSNIGEAITMNESIIDTLIDLSCYSIMTAMYIEDRYKV